MEDAEPVGPRGMENAEVVAAFLLVVPAGGHVQEHTDPRPDGDGPTGAVVPAADRHVNRPSGHSARHDKGSDERLGIHLWSG